MTLRSHSFRISLISDLLYLHKLPPKEVRRVTGHSRLSAVKRYCANDMSASLTDIMDMRSAHHVPKP